MTPPTEMTTASQRAHFQRDFFVSLASGPLPFDVTGKTVRPPPAGTNSVSADPVRWTPLTYGSLPPALGKHAVAISRRARTPRGRVASATSAPDSSEEFLPLTAEDHTLTCGSVVSYRWSARLSGEGGLNVAKGPPAGLESTPLRDLHGLVPLQRLGADSGVAGQ